MSHSDQYMSDFLEIFAGMARQGPGEDASTLKALAALPAGARLGRILDMGCGSGAAALVLARATGAQVQGLDLHQPFLNQLEAEAARQGLAGRVSTICASMLAPPLAEASVDLIWAEGSVFVMGLENALRDWRRLLAPPGYVALTEMVWLTDSPAPEIAAYMRQEHGLELRDAAGLEEAARAQGYGLLASFPLPVEAWDAFYADMRRCLERTRDRLGQTQAWADCAREADMFDRHRGQFGYQFLVLARR